MAETITAAEIKEIKGDEAAGGGDCGFSLLERLRQKYIDDDEDEDDAGAENDSAVEIFLSCSPIKASVAAGVRGALSLVVLNHTDITHLGDLAHLTPFMRHVSEIDLAWNRLASWHDVAPLLAADSLPSLRILNLSHNPLRLAAPDEAAEALPCNPHLRTLILNGTRLRLDALHNCVRCLPGLEELHISDNHFDEAYFDGLEKDAVPAAAAAISSSLRTLHANRCNLNRWSDVHAILSCFPSAEVVFLCDNPLREIRPSTAECQPSSSTESKENDQEPLIAAPNLRTLNISKTRVDNWASIEYLNSWPHLIDVRLAGIPLLEQLTDEERLHLVVGRLGRLEVLNGSRITKKERDTSERFFVRYYQEREQRPDKYAQLVEKHGKLEKLAKVDLTPQTHVRVKVVCEESGYDATMNLRLTRTVGQLMRTLERSTSIPYARMRLFFWDANDMAVEGATGPTELRFPNQQLYMLHIEDGSQFRVQSKLVLNRKRMKST